MSMNDIAPHLGPLGQFLAGLSVFLPVMLGGFVWLWGWMLKRTKREISMAVTSATMHRIIAGQMISKAESCDPSEYFTMPIEFEGGHSMAVPMFPEYKMMVAENIKMEVLDHNHECTELGLWCSGYGVMKKHRHVDACETVHVVRGTVTHYETGRVYRAGEVWVIEPGEWHSAFFSDCYCRIIHRPPLPLATVVPPNLDAMSRVFPEL